LVLLFVGIDLSFDVVADVDNYFFLLK